MSIEAMKQALEALEQWTTPHWAGAGVDKANAAHTALRAAIEQAEKQEPVALIDHMVNRFLGWKLPRDFYPDAGISFKPPTNPEWWPVGTNLLTAEQAKRMFSHCMEGYATPPAAPVQEPFHVISPDCAERGCMAHDDRVDGPGVVIGQRQWVGLIRGVRVDGETVVISVNGGNDAARELCGELLREKNGAK